MINFRDICIIMANHKPTEISLKPPQRTPAVTFCAKVAPFLKAAAATLPADTSPGGGVPMRTPPAGVPPPQHRRQEPSRALSIMSRLRTRTNNHKILISDWFPIGCLKQRESSEFKLREHVMIWNRAYIRLRI
jgi:hypothetical protein